MQEHRWAEVSTPWNDTTMPQVEFRPWQRCVEGVRIEDSPDSELTTSSWCVRQQSTSWSSLPRLNT